MVELRQALERASEGSETSLVEQSSGSHVFWTTLSGKRIEFVLSPARDGFECAFLMEYASGLMENWREGSADLVVGGEAFPGRRCGPHFVVQAGGLDAALRLMDGFFSAVRSAPPTELYADCRDWIKGECEVRGGFRVFESTLKRALSVREDSEEPWLSVFVHFGEDGTITRVHVFKTRVEFGITDLYDDYIQEDHGSVLSLEQFKGIVVPLLQDCRSSRDLVNRLRKPAV